ncbi:MAG: 2'-5' RNA ligase family protein [Bacteroidia bacterium]|nr:2'-5' RNA ligase family protein [Bacteroidia bacterium]
MNYFIALIPPEPVLSRVQALKEEMSLRFHSRQARYSPSHITLHMPFEWRVDREQELRDMLDGVAKNLHPFKIELQGFGAFAPRVIFVKPLPSEELRRVYAAVGEAARRRLGIVSQDAYAKPFHPHMTIAFRDLRKDQFNHAWEEFRLRPFSESFNCNGVSLLRKAGKYWVEHYRSEF